MHRGRSEEDTVIPEAARAADVLGTREEHAGRCSCVRHFEEYRGQVLQGLFRGASTRNSNASGLRWTKVF
jgi:hypothetical protein